MRIDYCPYCDKAGLKHQDSTGKDSPGYSDKTEDYGQTKWCPRCKAWVKPVHGEWHRKSGTTKQGERNDKQM